MASEAKRPSVRSEFYWSGFINHKIPVFIHYSIEDDLITGQLFYLNTKSRQPITLIGTIEEDSSYRILEFGKDGNISGIISGKPKDEIFHGEWFSPETRKEFPLHLGSKDTTFTPLSLEAPNGDIDGIYHYQYSEEGSQGDMQVKRLGENTIAFSIFSVTDAPARNLAEVPEDTVQLTGNSFIYTIPGSDGCQFKVRFYKDFSRVTYTRGYCEGQFGMNATVDGIYLKVKK